MWRFLLSAVLWAPCDKYTLCSLPRVCRETLPETSVLPHRYIQNYKQPHFFITVLEMIENSKGHFIPDEELATFIYEGMHSGMFCFCEKETFLGTEGKEEMEQVRESWREDFIRDWKSLPWFLLFFSLRGHCLPAPGRKQGQALLSHTDLGSNPSSGENSWGSYLISLSLSFLIHKMGMIVLPSFVGSLGGTGKIMQCFSKCTTGNSKRIF